MAQLDTSDNSLVEWFTAASSEDPTRVHRELRTLRRAAGAAIVRRDREAIERAELAWAEWRAKVQRANSGKSGDAWLGVVQQAGDLLAEALIETEPVAALQHLNEIAVDILWSVQDAVEWEVSTSWILERVLFRHRSEVDYGSHLGRLAAVRLLSLRIEAEEQYWRLTPLGRRTLEEAKRRVHREWERFRRTPEGATLAELLHSPEFRGRVPARILRAIDPAGAAPGAGHGDPDQFTARYLYCLLTAHLVRPCASEAQRDDTLDTVLRKFDESQPSATS